MSGLYSLYHHVFSSFASAQLVLALALRAEIKLGEQSAFAPFIKTLPHSLASFPVLWARRELEILCDASPTARQQVTTATRFLFACKSSIWFLYRLVLYLFKPLLCSWCLIVYYFAITFIPYPLLPGDDCVCWCFAVALTAGGAICGAASRACACRPLLAPSPAAGAWPRWKQLRVERKH